MSEAMKPRARAPTGGGRRVCAAGLLVAVAALLTLPLQAQAQKTTFVSNTGQSTDPDVRRVGPVKPPVVWTLSWVYSGGLPGGR